jgi:hypothetical protein
MTYMRFCEHIKLWKLPTFIENVSLSALLKALPCNDCLLAVAKQ